MLTTRGLLFQCLQSKKTYSNTTMVIYDLPSLIFTSLFSDRSGSFPSYLLPSAAIRFIARNHCLTRYVSDEYLICLQHVIAVFCTLIHFAGNREFSLWSLVFHYRTASHTISANYRAIVAFVIVAT